MPESNTPHVMQGFVCENLAYAITWTDTLKKVLLNDWGYQLTVTFSEDYSYLDFDKCIASLSCSKMEISVLKIGMTFLMRKISKNRHVKYQSIFSEWRHIKLAYKYSSNDLSSTTPEINSCDIYVSSLPSISMLAKTTKHGVDKKAWKN